MNEKIIALAKHLEIDFFEHKGIYYTGSTEEEYEEYSENELLDEDVKKEDILTKEEWAEQNCTLLEDEIEEAKYDENVFEHGGDEYLVCTDGEADDKWEEALDHYLEECIYPDLPETMKYYFDDEKWKIDARMDGRGHSLSSYDGCESEEEVNGTTYYIYRTN